MLDPKCIYPKCIRAKCTRLARLLSFANLFNLDCSFSAFSSQPWSSPFFLCHILFTLGLLHLRLGWKLCLFHNRSGHRGQRRIQCKGGCNEGKQDCICNSNSPELSASHLLWQLHNVFQLVCNMERASDLFHLFLEVVKI